MIRLIVLALVAFGLSAQTTVIDSRNGGATPAEIGRLSGVSSSVQGQIDQKAPLANPTFTGTVAIGATVPGQPSFLVNPDNGLGSYRMITIPIPAAPTVTPTGTGGATGYSYVVSAVMAYGTVSASSAAGSTAAGNGTLTAPNYNAVATAAATNAASCNVYRTAGGPTTGKIGNVVCGAALNDVGLVADGTVAPTMPTAPPAGTIFIYSKGNPITGLCWRTHTANSETCFQASIAGDTAAENEGFGWLVFQALTTGYYNTAFGSGALTHLATGNENTAFGADALNTYLGSNSSAFGSQVLPVATGSGNDGFGRFALNKLTTGADNTAFGVSTLSNLVSGGSNTAVGNNALNGLNGASSVYNVALGKYALLSATSPSNNTSIGGRSLKGVTTGGNNTALGFEAGVTATAANNLTTGANNTFLGYRSGPGSATQRSNMTALGASALCDADNTVCIGDSATTGLVFGGTAGVTVSGTSCTITAIKGGIITGATCTP